MSSLLKSIFMWLVIICGCIILFLGIKKNIFTDKKNRKLFIASLFLIFSLNSCNSDNDINNLSEKETLLIESNEWQNFKYFWQEMDRVDPGISIYTIDDENIEEATYQLSANVVMEKSEEQFELLSQHIRNLKSIKIISDYEIELLNRICLERISFLYQVDFLLLSHLAPPKIYYNKTETMNQFELKIDALYDLYNNKLINEQELNSSIEDLISELHNYLILTAIVPGRETNYDYYTLDETLENNSDSHIRFFNNYIERKFPDGNIDKKNMDILNDIEKINSTITSLQPLIEDLVSP